MRLLNATYNVYSLSFGKKRVGKRDYTETERRLRHEINQAAMNSADWLDVYTGRRFTKTNPSSVEHIIPYIERNNPNLPPGFNINGLENFIPAGRLGNMARGHEFFTDLIVEQPIILQRLMIEMEKYRKYKSHLIDGESWVQGLKKTLSRDWGIILK